MTEKLPSGSTVGILGGGQLGRMLAVAAARLGFKVHIFAPESDPPAADVALKTTRADYNDHDALRSFAQSCAVVTYEFENVPTDALTCITAHVPLRPGREALRISQDRLFEKQFLQNQNLNVAPFLDVPDRDTLVQAIAKIGVPSILKTRRFGYDGKGQIWIRQPDDAHRAFDALDPAPMILEGVVNFTREISVIAARGIAGDVACFDPGENVHEDGILRTTTVPARLSATQRSDAVLIAAKILNALEYVGVLGVELFVTEAGLLINEIAPRVHNSGHWTQNGCAVDQFEQHIRAITGWPLGDGERHADVVMQNLIGDDIAEVPRLAAERNTAVHLYGKAEVKPGRKMGHINRIIR
ncbi:MAG: 5-(carboxyamino)imidazole ribonucleotide synthase [Pseudomonadota bacterium]